VLAVDGKTVRGSAGDEQAARHLLAVIDHRAAVVLGQVDVASKTNEIPMFPLLCNRIDDLADTVITADALRAQKSHAEVGKRHPLSDNRLHWVRDVTFDEDRSQVRTGNGPAPWHRSGISPSASYESTAPPTSPKPARAAAIRIRYDPQCGPREGSASRHCGYTHEYQ
jgi:predicted transposase YbfD/YdcC